VNVSHYSLFLAPYPMQLPRSSGCAGLLGGDTFLTFFMLCTKDQMAVRMDGLFRSRKDAARFITNLNQMIRGFVSRQLRASLARIGTPKNHETAFLFFRSLLCRLCDQSEYEESPRCSVL